VAGLAAAGPALMITGQAFAAIGSAMGLISKFIPTIGGAAGAAGAGGAAAGTGGAAAAGGAAAGGIGAGAIASIAGPLALIGILLQNETFKKIIALTSAGIYGGIGGKAAGNDAFLRTANMLGLAGRANGGPVMAGQSYIVGERGPEVLSMGSSSGRVTPGGLTVIIQAQNLMGDAAGIQRAIEPALNQWARAKGVI
jgi:hypothetical protein